jgi:hypothetical protein
MNEDIEKVESIQNPFGTKSVLRETELHDDKSMPQKSRVVALNQ